MKRPTNKTPATETAWLQYCEMMREEALKNVSEAQRHLRAAARKFADVCKEETEWNSLERIAKHDKERVMEAIAAIDCYGGE